MANVEKGQGCSCKHGHGKCAAIETLVINGVITPVCGVGVAFESYLAIRAPIEDVEFSSVARKVRESSTIFNVDDSSLIEALRSEYLKRTASL